MLADDAAVPAYAFGRFFDDPFDFVGGGGAAATSGTGTSGDWSAIPHANSHCHLLYASARLTAPIKQLNIISRRFHVDSKVHSLGAHRRF